MNKTNIDWADVTWNPVTGCYHGCEYCYARRIAKRFEGHTDVLYASEYLAARIHALDGPLVNGDSKAHYPFGFEPTLLRYKLAEPQRAKLPRNIFVCSMADLFGRWVPTTWITQVLDACLAAPQHNYFFLTKNPDRYLELDKLAILPRKGNFWYGTTTTTEDAPFFYSDQHNTFVSVEPMHGPMHASGRLITDWVIVGAETGNRDGKRLPRREWVLALADECREMGLPIFMKKNLVKEGVLTQGEIIRQWPDGMTFS